MLLICASWVNLFTVCESRLSSQTYAQSVISVALYYDNFLDPIELLYVFLISLDRSVKYKVGLCQILRIRRVLEFTIKNIYDLKLLQEIEDES
jgi:hypothetical protein